MTDSYQKIIVLCPGGVATGGPELLHQLVHELRQLGKPAYISYYPSGRGFEKRDEYACYDTPQADIVDEAGVLCVVPEIRTDLAARLKKSRLAIWWMSVDNYFGRRGESLLKDAFNRIRTLWNGRRPVALLRNHMHLAQSSYARGFLSDAGIDSFMLTDYISSEHLNRERRVEGRRDLIVYNPKKGFSTTSGLIKSLPQFTFVPVQGMQRGEVAKLLGSAKLYIDFGNHPGKDRMPREAAMAGCCVITGLRGAAANSEDVPIDPVYKFNDRRGVDVGRFRDLTTEIFQSFAEHSARFERYRDGIIAEPDVFRRQVMEIFGRE